MGQRRLRSVLRAAVSSDSTGLALVLSSSIHCVREGDEQPQICCEVDAAGNAVRQLEPCCREICGTSL